MIAKPGIETLMAYADGQLADGARAEVEAALKQFPELLEDIQLYEESRQLMQDALAPKLLEPVPKHLEDLVLNAPSLTGRSSPLDQARSRKRGKFAPGWLQAAAACVAVVSAAVAGYAGGHSDQPRETVILAGPVDAGSWLGEALSVTASGKTHTEGGASFKAIATYVGADGDVCREIELAQGGHASGAIACRSGEHWEIRLAAALGPVSSSADYRPASGSASDALYLVLDEISAGDALSLEQERCLTQNGWAPTQTCSPVAN